VHEDEDDERCCACERWLTALVAELAVAGKPKPETCAEVVLVLGSGELGDADGLGEAVDDGDVLTGGELLAGLEEDAPGVHDGDGRPPITQGGDAVDVPGVGEVLPGMVCALPAGWPPLLPLLPLPPCPEVEPEGDMTLGTSIAM
jgi:hypothetical protein